MDLSFYPLTLEAIDQAAAESLCLFVAADERPLTGLAGLADWRLSGRLSRLLRSGLLTGEAGEAVLTPPGARLAFQKLFLFGLGKVAQTEEQLAGHVAEALRKLAQAGVREAALQLPARLPVELGVRTLIDELQGPGRALVFATDPQKLVAALSQAATRGTLQLERRVVKVAPPQVKPPLPSVKPVTPPPPPAPKPAGLPFAVTARTLPTAPAQPLPTGPSQTQPAAPAQALPAAPTPALPLPDAPALPAVQPLPEGPASALPLAAPLPTGPSEPKPAPPTAPDAASAEPPPPAGPGAPAAPADEKRPALPPSQRYVPPPPKPHVFESGKRKK